MAADKMLAGEFLVWIIFHVFAVI